MPPWESREGYLLLKVRVQPRASRNAFKQEADGRLRVYLTAPPVEGAANEALCEFVAKRLGIAKSSISVVAGEKSREKTLKIMGATAQELDQVFS